MVPPFFFINQKICRFCEAERLVSKLRVLDLFSGIGGFSLGLERTGGFETVAFCEIDPFCRKVLKKHWPEVPCFEDVRTLDAAGLGRIDLVTGGYPCQPFSHAGKRLGAEDDRHLWPEMLAVIKAVRPTWVIGENVAGHISMGLDDVLFDLDAAGYAARAFAIPAVAVGAHHRRMRVWIVAHDDCACGDRHKVNEVRPRWDAAESCVRAVADAHRPRPQGWDSGSLQERPDERAAWAGGSSVADTAGIGRGEGHQDTGGRSEGTRTPIKWPGFANGGGWLPEPELGRVAHGIPNRVDRLKALGNAVVPQIPELIGRAILASMQEAA